MWKHTKPSTLLTYFHCVKLILCYCVCVNLHMDLQTNTTNLHAVLQKLNSMQLKVDDAVSGPSNDWLRRGKGAITQTGEAKKKK